jgi:hypothetical protein
MSKDSITLTVPLSYIALTATAKMLQGLAEQMAGSQPHIDPTPVEVFRSPLVEAVADSSGMAPEFIDLNPKKVLTDADLAGEAKTVFAPPPPVAETLAPISMAEVADSRATAPVETEDLDANGLPWDARIHAATKTKDAKGNWKYLRGVDRDVLVPEIEAELREAMGDDGAWYTVDAYPNAQPDGHTGTIITDTPPAPPAPVAPTATPSTSVTTFAQLVTGITSKSIPEWKVNAALAEVGLQHFALLGARPDLISTVAGHLGL